MAVVVPSGTQHSLEIRLEDQSTSSPTKGSLPALIIAIADTPMKANHSWKASFEVAILVALAAVLLVGLALFLSGKFLPFLIAPIITIGGLLALIGTLGLSSFGKLWNIFTDRFYNSNHFITYVVSGLLALIILATVYGLPYLLSDPYIHLARPLTVLDDRMQTPSDAYNWSQGPHCGFDGVGYRVQTLSNESGHYCIADSFVFDNFVYQVQMKIIHGNCGGMVFRVNLAHRTAYIFYICPDRGTYCLERENIHIEYVVGCQTDAGLPNGCRAECCVTMYNEKLLNSVQIWLQGFSALYHYTKFEMASPNGVGILSSRETITLAVIANGINFTLYVNHNMDPIHAVDDSEQALKQGQIGVDTEALKDNGIYYPSQIEFTNAKVWTLS